jgi:hypothetical protein
MRRRRRRRNKGEKLVQSLSMYEGYVGDDDGWMIISILTAFLRREGCIL